MTTEVRALYDRLLHLERPRMNPTFP
jgi:hypothetical protein